MVHMSVAVRTELPAQTAVVEPSAAQEIERVALGLLPVAQGRIDDQGWVSAAREAWEEQIGRAHV